MSTGHHPSYNRNGSVLPKLYDEQNLSVDGPAPRSNRVRIFAILSVVLLVVVAVAVSLGVVLSKNDGGNNGKPVLGGVTTPEATEPSPAEAATDAPSSAPPKEFVISPSPTADQTPTPEPPAPPTSQAQPSPSPAVATTPPPTSVTTPAPTWVPTIAAVPSNTATPVPTLAATVAAAPTNTSTVDQFLSGLPTYSRELAFGNASSPQATALDWLRSDPLYGEYELHRLNQRYALAVFFHSTDGRSWSISDGWMSYENECAWYQHWTAWAGGVCAEGSRLSVLDSYNNELGGSLPTELELLSDLGRMYLYGAFVGTIHPELCVAPLSPLHS
jgi:hypothetical protein